MLLAAAGEVGILIAVEVLLDSLKHPLDLVLVNISIGNEGLLQSVER